MISIIEVIAVISILIALSVIALFVKDFMARNKEGKLSRSEDAFCDINLEFMKINDQDNSNEGNGDLSKKLQDFILKNRYYRM